MNKITGLELKERIAKKKALEASAPDLLDALKSILEEMRNDISKTNRDRAAKAIAKAEGRA